VVGHSTVVAPEETAKAGDLGQFPEMTALQLAVTPMTLDEGCTRQLGTTQGPDPM